MSEKRSETGVLLLGVKCRQKFDEEHTTGKEQPTEAENLATAIGRNQQCRPLDGPVDRLTLDSH